MWILGYYKLFIARCSRLIIRTDSKIAKAAVLQTTQHPSERLLRFSQRIQQTQNFQLVYITTKDNPSDCFSRDIVYGDDSKIKISQKDILNKDQNVSLKQLLQGIKTREIDKVVDKPPRSGLYQSQLKR